MQSVSVSLLAKDKALMKLRSNLDSPSRPVGSSLRSIGGGVALGAVSLGALACSSDKGEAATSVVPSAVMANSAENGAMGGNSTPNPSTSGDPGTGPENNFADDYQGQQQSNNEGTVDNMAIVEGDGQESGESDGTVAVEAEVLPEPAPVVELPSTEPTVSGTVDVTVNINTNQRFQTITGFGASQVFYVDWITLNPNKDEIYDILFRDLGLDVLRVGNWYQGRTMQDQQIQNTIEVIERATESLGEPPQILMTSWTPPADLKSNQQLANGGTLAQQGGSYAYGPFGDWWRESIDAYAAAGVSVDFVGIQNEPDFTAPYESALFDPTEGQFAGFGQALSAVRNSFATLAAKPLLVGPEVIGIGNNRVGGYLNGLNMDDLDVVAHHLYNGGQSPDDPDSYIGNMSQVAAAAGEKPIFMTEFTPEEQGSGPLFFTTAWLIHNALTIENVSAYLYWNLAWRDRGENQPIDPGMMTLEDPRPDAPPFTTEKGYTVNPSYYAVKHFSKWLERDFQRVGADSTVNGLRASAYISPGSDQVTVILLNTDPQAHTVSLNTGDFAIGNSSAFRTAGNVEQTAALSALGEGNSVTLPSRSVVTVVFNAAN